MITEMERLRIRYEAACRDVAFEADRWADGIGGSELRLRLFVNHYREAREAYLGDAFQNPECDSI